MRNSNIFTYFFHYGKMLKTDDRDHTVIAKILLQVWHLYIFTFFLLLLYNLH